jgi:hypothetical protein
VGRSGAAPNAQIGIIPRVVVGQLQIFFGNDELKKGQGIHKHLLGNVEQIAPVKVHRHRIGFVEADNLHQVFRRIRQHRSPCLEAMHHLGKGMGGRGELGRNQGRRHGKSLQLFTAFG